MSDKIGDSWYSLIKLISYIQNSFQALYIYILLINVDKHNISLYNIFTY